MPQLVFRYDDGGVESFSLDADVIGVGRLTDNSIVIDNDYISGHHARLLREPGGGYRLFDLNSNNGTYVNDRLIKEHPLQHGETIRFGVFEVQYWHMPETPPPPAPLPPAAPGHAQEPSPAKAEAEAELLRLEARRAELQILLVQEHRKFEELKDQAIPGLASQVNALRAELGQLSQQRDEAILDLESQANALRAEIGQLRRQRDEAKSEFEALQLRLQETRDGLATTTRELEGKRAALSTSVNELMAAETSRDEAKREHEELRSLQDRAARALEVIQQERDQLVTKNKAIVAAVAEAEAKLSSLRQSIEAEASTRTGLERENEELRQRSTLARDRLQMAEARVLGKIRDWNEFETNQLTLIVERKAKLEEQCTSAEARLSKARDELADLRDRMRSETDGSSAALQDLRLNHYEPTKELHEELTLRNEELANEIARKEQKLRQLEVAIRESRETEQIVSSSLEQKGQVLENLEQRIGEEVSRIAASVISLQRPSSAGKPPRLADLGEIFVPSSAPPPVGAISSGGRNGSGRTSLLVFDPNAQARSIDFTAKVELEIEESPLPVGFMGLAAATRGAFFTSLARTVEANRPVLLVTGDDLQGTHSHLKKLRAALPSQIILLGWRAATFIKVTECLHSGTNFQDLLAMLAISDGSLTTDPYMNTFFESLNQAKRFLYLPPALPWNPKPRPAHGTRSGIYVDITAFQPEDPAANHFIGDLKAIVESTRQLLTIPEVSRARARRLQERLELGTDWTRIIPIPEYRELLVTLGNHLAIASFEETGFDHPLLRDALLTGTLLLAPGGPAYQTFFPKLAHSAASRTYADPALVSKLFDAAEDYDETMQGAEKALIEGHSYQAACRQIDTFMSSLRR